MTSHSSFTSDTTSTSASICTCIFNSMVAVTLAGHGEVRLSNVLPLMSGDGLDPELDLYVLDNQRIREGETVRLEIEITPQIVSSPIKITLCWYDPPAPMGSSRSLLMHDLDLVVVAPDGAMHWGNANSGEDNHSSGDSKKGQQRRAGDPPGSNSSFPGWAWADDTNPNEQVSITVRSDSAFKYDFFILYLDHSKYYSLLFLYLSLLVESSLFWRKAVSYWVHLLRIYTC